MSKLVIGTANFGLDYGINNRNGKLYKNEIINILKMASKNGINFIDTAQAYGDAEQRLGKILSNLLFDFNIITKLNPKGLDDVEKQFKISYNALNIKSIYAILYHNFEYFINYPESKDILEKKKEQGKIKKVGFSLYYPRELEYLFENNISFDIIQVPYNVFDRRFEYLFSELKSRNIEIHTRSVFLQGLMFKNPESLSVEFDEAKEKIIALKNISEETEMSIEGICIGFVTDNDLIDKTVIGIDSAGQLKKNIAYINKSVLTDAVKRKLFGLSIDDESIILPFNWKKN